MLICLDVSGSTREHPHRIVVRAVRSAPILTACDSVPHDAHAALGSVVGSS